MGNWNAQSTADAGSQGHVLANCQAWQSNKGTSKVEAIKKYVSRAEQLVSAYGQ